MRGGEGGEILAPITITTVIVIPPPNMASKSFTIKGAAFINSRNDQPRSVFSLRGFPGAPWYARCPLVCQVPSGMVEADTIVRLVPATSLARTAASSSDHLTVVQIDSL